MKSTWIIAVCLAGIWAGCARAPIQNAREALRPVAFSSVEGFDLPVFPGSLDGLDLSSLTSGIEKQLEFWSTNGVPTVFKLGPVEVAGKEYVASLKRWVEFAKSTSSRQEMLKYIETNFDFFEVYGRGNWGEVFITSYYEPIIPGDSKPTARFSQPLYRKPADILKLDLKPFDPEKLADIRMMRGRVENGAVVPYYSREDIDVRGVLKGQNLELCWVDPLDAFFLQIQGSGVVQLEGGKELRVGVADRNGHRYDSIGKFLTDVIPLEEMTLPRILTHLRSLTPDQRQAILNRNASYIFFQELQQNAVTFLGVPATSGRTIATDPKFFPKGALAFLVADTPEGTRFSRFVLDQDKGGAITGPGRVDLFWGRGPEAEEKAGVFKQIGKLYYLVPKLKS